MSEALRIRLTQALPLGPLVLPAGVELVARRNWAEDIGLPMEVVGEADEADAFALVGAGPQSLGAAAAVLALPDGTLINPAGGVLRLAPAEQVRPFGLDWPLSEGSGTVATGNPAAVPLTLVGGVGWGSPRGIAMNGTGYAQVDSAAQQGLLRDLCNLDSLTTDTMLLVFMALTHGTSLANTSTLMFWGRNGGTSPEGWGIKLSSTLSPRFYHRPAGSSAIAFQQLGLTNLNQSDSNNNNTISALGVGISRTAQGDLEVMSGCLYLDKPGTYNQVNRTRVITPLAKANGGTRPARYVTDASLTVGAMPGSAQNSVSDVCPSGVTVHRLVLQRRARDPGCLYAGLNSLALARNLYPAATLLAAN